jgi:hypothetical protein
MWWLTGHSKIEYFACVGRAASTTLTRNIRKPFEALFESYVGMILSP